MSGREHEEAIQAIEAAEPLAERLPRYAVYFTVGAVALAGIGLVWGLATDSAILDTVSWAQMLGGVVLLLAGGASGGGYANLGLGAFGSLFGTGDRYDENFEDDASRWGRRRRIDPRERLRKGLRPGPNPTAFWQVVAGFAYIGTGVLIIEMFG